MNPQQQFESEARQAVAWAVSQGLIKFPVAEPILKQVEPHHGGETREQSGVSSALPVSVFKPVPKAYQGQKGVRMRMSPSWQARKLADIKLCVTSFDKWGLKNRTP